MARGQQRKEEYDDVAIEDPPSIDPYKILGLETDASQDEVKKAYRKKALQHHPDKVMDEDKSHAHTKFQEIAFAYAVLSDERRRKRYDVTGSTAESMHDDDDFDWLSFYREQFDDVVTEDSIKKIADEYKGGAEERKNIMDAYVKYKGKLDKIYDVVMLSDILEDDDRFRQIIDEEIENGAVESYPAYERVNTDELREKAKAAESKRRENFTKKHGSAKEAAEKAKSKQKAKGKHNGDGGLGELAALIQGRQKARMGPGFFDHLEAKYAPAPAAKGKGKKKAAPMDDEPSEEAFLAARAKVEERAQARQGNKRATPMDEEAAEETPAPRKRLQTRAGRAATKATKKQDEDEDDEESEHLDDESDDIGSESEVSEEEVEKEPTSPPRRKRGTATVKSRGRAKA